MSGSVIHSQSAVMVPAVYSAGQPASLPVAIDYPAALALRQMSMVHDEPRQPGGCKLKTAPVRPVVAARPAEYVCSEDLFY
ncbi:hypothetical protein HL546_08525 [Escherichia coli]|nr:hypothetical protein [Escherichia coli]NNT79461.1 hypothetical protein [Escherichia coli]HDP9200098.1 hypothetical protein [Escherichia coli]HDQ0354541.1 hypothetical protein [Escherichia coli]HDQ1329389.1 hypothetical protein [Escherichia coli]